MSGTARRFAPRLAAASPFAVVAAVVVGVLSACPSAQRPVSTAPASGSAGSAAPAGRTLEPIPAPPPLSLAPGAAAGPLAVVAARPQGKAEGNVRPTVTFSRPVALLANAEAATARPPASIAPALPGEWRWIGSASAEFVPEKPLPLATAFTVTVPAGVRAVDGATLDEPYTFTFETPRPQVIDSRPWGGFNQLPKEPVFSLTFDQPVRELARHARLLVGTARRPVALAVAKEVGVAEEIKQKRKERPDEYVYDWYEPPRGFADVRTRYELKPVEPLPVASPVVLQVATTLPGAQGPLTLAEAYETSYATYGPYAIRRADACSDQRGGAPCPWGPLALLVSNETDLASLKQRLTLKPAVALDWDGAEQSTSGEGTRIVVPGPFIPGTAYAVDVAAGVRDAFGQVAPAFKGVFKTTDVDPDFYVENVTVLAEAAGDGAIPVRTVNIPKLDVKTWTMSPSEMARAFAATQDWESKTRWWVPARKAVVRTVSTAARRNAYRWGPVPLREALPAGRKTGLFAVEMLPAGWKAPQRILAQVTDLAVHARLGAKDGVVWVTRLSSGAPVAGATVELFGEKGERLGPAMTTDADGLARVSGLFAGPLVKAKEAYGVLVAATEGTDVGVALASRSYNAFNSELRGWRFGVAEAWPEPRPALLGEVFTERGIYRPGDEVHVKGVLREERLGRIAPPAAGTKLALRFVGPRGDEAAQLAVTTSAYGTFDATFTVPRDAPLGYWQATAVLGEKNDARLLGGSFRVEEYRAPQFLVDVAAPRAALAAGDAFEATATARYLHGGALAGAAVRWSVTRQTGFFSVPALPAFTFGPNAWGWDDHAPRPSSDLFASGEGTLGNDGTLRLAPGKADAPASRTWTYTVEAAVTDVNRQQLAGRAEVTVHPADVYAGVRDGADGFAAAGKPVDVHLVAAATDGTLRAGVPLTLEVKRRTWNAIRKKGPSGEWFTETEPVEETVASCRETSAAEPRTCRFTPPGPGLYLLSAVATDAAGRSATTTSTLYAVGPGWISWRRDDGPAIDLVADRTSYEPGDVARVLVKSPFPKADAVITVEREGILSVRRVTLEGAATAVEVPVTDEMVPNAYVSVVLTRGRIADAPRVSGDPDPGRPLVRAGLVELKVKDASRRLAVEVTPDATEKRPRQPVTVDLRVRDAAGRPAKTEVAVWAVDEGVLRLTDYKNPDLVSAVHRPRGLAVLFSDALMTLIKRREYQEKGGTPTASDGGATGGFAGLNRRGLAWGGGGGDASGAGFRTQFKTTVLFAPRVETDAEGRARVSFELPDNLTTFRIMAVAIDAGERFGDGRAKVTSTKPLLAQPALPRFSRGGDAFEAGVVVHSRDGKDRKVRVTAAAQGARIDGAASDGTAQRDVTVVAGKAQEVRFRFLADAPGTAALRFRVEGGGESDAVEQRVPVTVPTATETVAAYGDTTDRRVEGIARPRDARPDVGGLTVEMSSTALGGFGNAIRQLEEYPYGCVEQLSSRLVPFVAQRQLARAFGLDPAEASKPRGDARDPDQVVGDTIQKIAALQGGDGGFRYWPSSSCAWPYASAYATLALGLARDAGYPVNEDVLRRAQQYLADTVLPGEKTHCDGYRYTPDTTERIFAAFALARTGMPRASSYEALFAKRGEVPLFARAMLADAILSGGGDRKRGQALLTELLNSARETAAEVHFQEVDGVRHAEYWSSDARTTAIALMVLADHAPDHPYVGKIARWVARARDGKGEYRTTQESAFALLALLELLKTKEKDAPDFTATVSLGAETLLREAFRGRSVDAVRRQVPFASLPQGEAPLTITKEGDGVLYYSASLRYAPTALDPAPLDRGIVVQRWFEPWNGGGQARVFRAGELVRLKVRLASPAERRFVAVEVPIPAGLEIVDTSLATAARPPRPSADSAGAGLAEGDGPPDAGAPLEGELADDVEGDDADDEPGPWAYAWWSPFNHRELRDDRVLLFADQLPPGVFETEVVTRATTAGTFVLPPAYASEMYTPEVFGRTDAGTFRITLEGP